MDRDPNLSGLLLVKRSVLLDEFFPVFWHLVDSMNRVGLADWNASAAIDAAVGVHIHLGSFCELGLVLLRMNTISCADVSAERILDASIGNYIGHDQSVSTVEWALSALSNMCMKLQSHRP